MHSTSPCVLPSSVSNISRFKQVTQYDRTRVTSPPRSFCPGLSETFIVFKVGFHTARARAMPSCRHVCPDLSKITIFQFCFHAAAASSKSLCARNFVSEDLRSLNSRFVFFKKEHPRRLSQTRGRVLYSLFLYGIAFYCAFCCMTLQAFHCFCLSLHVCACVCLAFPDVASLCVTLPGAACFYFVVFYVSDMFPTVN